MKGNNGRGARKRLTRQLFFIIGGFLALLFVLSVLGVGTTKQLRDTPLSNNQDRSAQILQEDQEQATEHQFDMARQFTERGEGKLMEEVLSGRLHLVELYSVREELIRSPSNTYAGVYGKFCRLNWALHKKDPSAVPMFRDLVAKSQECEKTWTLDIHKTTELARHRDGMKDGKVKPLNLTAVVFHESRCGSTLAANMMAAMDPVKHRAYSESQPCATALKICGEDFRDCSEKQAAMVLRDTIYLMSRTDDPMEERVFFKFQSATTKSIKTFQRAFPETPWMFIYRDPVQVMMSHIKDDPGLKKAICVRSRPRPPQDIIDIAKRHGESDARYVSGEDYCAAHLAAITESAVRVLNDYAIPIDYKTMPDILWEAVLPKIFGRSLTPTEINNLDQISHSYSKGRGKRHKEFTGDSEQKEETASEEVHLAAKKYLHESFVQLSEFEPKLLQ